MGPSFRWLTVLGGTFLKVSLTISKRERNQSTWNDSECCADIWVGNEIGSLMSFNRWEVSALSPHHLESQPSQFAQDWRDSRTTFTAKTKMLPGKQGQVDYPTTILLFLISSIKTVSHLTSWFKVSVPTLWLGFFFFFFFWAIPNVGEWVSSHLYNTSYFPLWFIVITENIYNYMNLVNFGWDMWSLWCTGNRKPVLYLS